MIEQSAILTVNSPSGRWFTPLGVTLLVPVVLALIVLWTSPNFLPTTHEHRSSPFGGDFLQEWIGGNIVISAEREKLYDGAFFKSLQHRPELTGFTWPNELYYPPVYPPGYYYLLSPFTNFDYRTASVIWLLISISCLVATFALLYQFYPPTRCLFPWLPLATLLFSPLLYSLGIGHKSTVLLLVFTATYLLLHHRKTYLAGVCFGVIAFKPQLLIVMLLVMLMKREWKFVCGATTSVALGWVLCLLAGLDLCFDYIQVLAGAGDFVRHNGYRFDLAHSLWSFYGGLLGESQMPVSKLLAGLSCLVCMVWLWRMFRGPLLTQSDRFVFQYSAMIIVTILVSPHFYFYDLTILWLPIALLLPLGIRSEQARPLAAAAVGFGLLAGAFTAIAQVTSIQFSIIWFGVLLLFLDHRIRTLHSAVHLASTP